MAWTVQHFLACDADLVQGRSDVHSIWSTPHSLVVTKGPIHANIMKVEYSEDT